MAQNIYNDPGFFEGYSQLPRSRLGLDGAPEWAAIRDLLSDVTGKSVVDLGCGFGWFARWARAAGAASVLGLDVSENMIARAVADTDDPSIEYQIADLETLALRAETFDLAYSSLALHYIRDFDRLVRAVRGSLTPGGCFVFTIEHPVYMASAPSKWIEHEGRRAWPVNQYFREGKRETDWLADGVIKYHRTIGTTLNALIGGGFVIQHVQEWHPSDAQLEEHPELAEEMDRPMFLMVKAHA